jgi:hypothetical protein
MERSASGRRFGRDGKEPFRSSAHCTDERDRRPDFRRGQHRDGSLHPSDNAGWRRYAVCSDYHEGASMSIATPSAGNATYPPQGLTPTHEQIVRHLRHASAVAERATLLGHHPFGAILVGPDQESLPALRRSTSRRSICGAARSTPRSSHAACARGRPIGRILAASCTA